MTIEPTPEQFRRLATSDDDEPVVMVNLLRFKPRAEGIDAEDGITGAEAYGRYAAAVTTFLTRVGGRVLFAAEPQESVIGPEPGEWDLVLAVEYPSRSAFVAMTSDPEYLAIHGHRAAALADSRLIACTSISV
ncbi:MAG TPA: DUF1330 domain-containing protein [Solirubrobacteraceae bacterium]